MQYEKQKHKLHTDKNVQNAFKVFCLKAFDCGCYYSPPSLSLYLNQSIDSSTQYNLFHFQNGTI